VSTNRTSVCACIFLITLTWFHSGYGSYALAQNSQPVDGAARKPEVTAEERAKWRIPTEPQSDQTAARVLGIAQGAITARTVDLVSLEKSSIPYLAAQVVKKALWRVELKGPGLQLASSPPGFQDRYERTWDIYLDPVAGNLVRIETQWPSGQPRMEDELDADQAAAQMSASGNEKYWSFPAEAPQITLIDALDAMQRGGGNPLIAKQIIADYVLWSRFGERWQAARPVWAVTLRGVPPPRRRGTTNKRDSSERYVVDAKTGELLCVTNVPHRDSFTRPPVPEP